MTNSSNDRFQMNILVEKLRQRLKNFAVVDRQSEKLGEVKDILLDANRQLNLVVARLDSNLNPPQFLLISKLIKKIEPANKTVLVDVDREQVKNFPEYVLPVTENENPIESSNNTPLPDLDLFSTATKQDEESINATSNVIEHPVQPTLLFETKNMQNEVQNDINLESSQEQVVLGEEIVRLLGERVVVERNKRKVGEVIVRKEIETRMVQVPVRYEKLIIEQVGSEPKQLAEIDLGQAPISNGDLPETVVTATKTIDAEQTGTTKTGELTVSGFFNSPKIASLLLNAIAMERRHGCKQIRVEIVVEDEERKKTYQEWFARTSKKQ